MKIVIATFNPDKVRELERLIDLPGATLVSLREFARALRTRLAGLAGAEILLLRDAREAAVLRECVQAGMGWA